MFASVADEISANGQRAFSYLHTIAHNSIKATREIKAAIRLVPNNPKTKWVFKTARPEFMATKSQITKKIVRHSTIPIRFETDVNIQFLSMLSQKILSFSTLRSIIFSVTGNAKICVWHYFQTPSINCIPALLTLSIGPILNCL